MLIFWKLDIQSEIDYFLSRKPKLCKCMFGNMLMKTALMGPHKLNTAPIHHRLISSFRQDGRWASTDWLHSTCGLMSAYTGTRCWNSLHLSQRDLWVYWWVGNRVTLEWIKTLEEKKEGRCKGNYSGRGSQRPGSASALPVWGVEAPNKLFILFLHPSFPSSKTKL